MPEQAPTLRDMIQAVLDGGLTYRQLEARAIDPETGKTASKDLFNNIIGNKVDRIPYDYHLRAIAVGLGVPYERVRQAAIRQWLPAEQVAAGADEGRAQLIEEARDLRARHLDAAASAEKLLAHLEGRDTDTAASA